MALFTAFAGCCALLQGLAGLAGTVLILLCVDFPTVLLPVHYQGPENVTTAAFTDTTITAAPAQEWNPTEGVSKLHLKPIKILVDGYSKDPNRDLIFCFAITCSVFNFIWIISSLLLILNHQAKSAQVLWQWVLATLASVFTDFVGAVYFAAKLGDHVTSFDNSQEDYLTSSTFTFLKYIYPLILFLVFGKGFITIPINLLLAMCINKKAHSYQSVVSKRQGISESILKHKTPLYPVVQSKNGASETGSTNGASPSAVYSNQCFTLDEKY